MHPGYKHRRTKRTSARRTARRSAFYKLNTSHRLCTYVADCKCYPRTRKPVEQHLPRWYTFVLLPVGTTKRVEAPFSQIADQIPKQIAGFYADSEF